MVVFSDFLVSCYNRGKQTRVYMKEDRSVLIISIFHGLHTDYLMHINETDSFIRKPIWKPDCFPYTSNNLQMD